VERLNYHHLLYFWLVAREGSVSAAAARLRLAQPTLSSQIRTLESVLGERLFEKAGRRLRLTDVGQTVFRFADEIFSLGQELMDTIKRRPTGHRLRLTIGLVDVVTKPMAHRLIRPLLDPPDPIRVVVREDNTEKLLAALVANELDVLILDSPPGPDSGARVFSHRLGESGVTLLATPDLARRYRARFPKALDGAPFLLPARTTGLRRGLEQWFDRHHIRPHVVGEFDDSALVFEFGRSGSGIFALPSVVEGDVRRKHGFSLVGRVDELKRELFAVALQRRVSHPGVASLIEHARTKVFA
jgi:LysR family transcriptional regulator, transcriptional activator of nhaA